MKTLYLVRHGTVHNPDKILYRRLPGFLLSEQGRNEAAETAAFLADEPIDLIWYSPLERAAETAAIINARHQLPTVEELRILEWEEDEDSDEVAERMWSFLEIWRQTDYEFSAAVSHRDPIRRLLFSIRDRDETPNMEDLTQFPLPQAGVYRVTEEQGVLRSQLVFVPSESHLSPRIEVDKIDRP